MGHTHYWENLVPNGDLATKARRIIKESGVVVCGPAGNGTAIITPWEILLNGDETKDHDCETFALDGTNSFCKTNRKPYDEVVVAILVAAIAQGNGEVSTDGNLEDWQAGIDLYQRVIGPLPNLRYLQVIQAINR